MAQSIAKELNIANMQLTEAQEFQLQAVLNDLKPYWLTMTPEAAYEDIYKTLKSIVELWARREI